MITVSKEYKNELNNGNRAFLCYADVTLKNGIVLHLDNSKIWEGGFKHEDAVSQSDSFEIGSAIINKMTFTINNITEEYSLYDFDGAEVRAYIGLELSDGKIEKLKKGIYVVDNPTYNGVTIDLECLDRMKFFDRKYDSTLSYPTTLGQIVYDACVNCNVPLRTANFFNSSYTVTSKPSDAEITYREIIAYVAQLSASYARFNNEGELEFKWYDKEVFDFDKLDGGNFKEYELNDIVNGGDFTYTANGNVIDGGTFDDANKYHHLYSTSSITVGTDQIEITGFKLSITEGEETKDYFSGKEGYVLAIENNPLAQENIEGLVASIAGQVIGLQFRTFNVQALAEPSMEAGDPVMISDLKGNAYYSYITSLSFEVGNFGTFACGAKTTGEQESTRYNVVTKNIVAVKKEVNQKLSNYEYEFNQFNNLISNAIGFYTTKVTGIDGSLIVYLHEKPQMELSQTIWKISVDGFAVSLDGGKTWTAGITKNGNIIANILSVVGVNADWINVGILKAIEMIGCIIRGSYIESKNGNDRTIINNGIVITNRIALESLNGIGNGYLTTSILSLWKTDGTKGIVVNAETGDINTYGRVIVGNALFQEDQISLRIQAGKTYPVINGFEIAYQNDLKNYVTGSYFNEMYNKIYQDFVLKIVFDAHRHDDLYMPISKIYTTYEIIATTGGSDGVIVFSNASAAGNIRVSNLEARVSRLESTASDLRLKKDLKLLTDIKDMYMDFKPYTFTYKSDFRGDEIQSGLIAQQVISNLKQHGYNINDYGLVNTFEPYEKSDEGQYVGEQGYRINYNNLHAWHISMIQEQQKEIDELKEENKRLSERLDRLEQLLSKQSEVTENGNYNG